MVKNLPAMQETGFDPWVRKIPWRREWQITPVSLPGKFHGQRSLAAYSRWDRKESDMTEKQTLTGSRAEAQQFWHTGLAAPMHVGSSCVRDLTHISCIGGQILYH